MGGGAGARGLRPGPHPRQWRFPADFGAHPDHRTEWWYYTGNLETEAGRAFGYQFTIFRQALVPEAPPEQGSRGRGSAWRTPQVYSAHFTVSDIATDTFLQEERFARGALGLAGAEADPYAVWLNDWRISAEGPSGRGCRPPPGPWPST